MIKTAKHENIPIPLLGINFYKNKLTFFFLFGLVPLAGRILRGLENTTG